MRRGNQAKLQQGPPQSSKWVKGKSANPGGIRKEVRLGVENVMILARLYTEDSVHALGRIVREGKTENAIVAAATVLLDRAWGKPKQDLTLYNGGVANEHLPVSEAARLIREAIIDAVSRNDEEVVHGRPLLPPPLRNGKDRRRP